MKHSGVCDMNDKLKAKRLNDADMEKVSGGKSLWSFFSEGQTVYYTKDSELVFVIKSMDVVEHKYVYEIESTGNPSKTYHNVPDWDLYLRY